MQMFCAALFCAEGRRKTSPQSCKTQIKILLFPELAQLGSEQPGPRPRSYAFFGLNLYITGICGANKQNILGYKIHLKFGIDFD